MILKVVTIFHGKSNNKVLNWKLIIDNKEFKLTGKFSSVSRKAVNLTNDLGAYGYVLEAL